jgi:imidazole glycerol-phosphate synthase subunit HisF
MLRPRIIPCLLVHNRGLVKTIKFKDPKYVGDPINAVKIFNEKEVDELVVLDIDASIEKREPDFTLIKNLAAECRMPFGYGGGVKTVEHARQIISLGAEKVIINTTAIENPDVIPAMARAVGTQSVVVMIDVKKVGLFGKYEVVYQNGQKTTGKSPVDFAKYIENLGVGEIVINSVDKDGTMEGYDMKLLKSIRDAISVPMSVVGGAGSLNDIKSAIENLGVVGAVAGSLFVFKGKYRAVLINYPNPEEKKELLKKYL